MAGNQLERRQALETQSSAFTWKLQPASVRHSEGSGPRSGGAPGRQPGLINHGSSAASTQLRALSGGSAIPALTQQSCHPELASRASLAASAVVTTRSVAVDAPLRTTPAKQRVACPTARVPVVPPLSSHVLPRKSVVGRPSRLGRVTGKLTWTREASTTAAVQQPVARVRGTLESHASPAYQLCRPNQLRRLSAAPGSHKGAGGGGERKPSLSCTPGRSAGRLGPRRVANAAGETNAGRKVGAPWLGRLVMAPAFKATRGQGGSVAGGGRGGPRSLKWVRGAGRVSTPAASRQPAVVRRTPLLRATIQGGARGFGRGKPADGVPGIYPEKMDLLELHGNQPRVIKVTSCELLAQRRS